MQNLLTRNVSLFEEKVFRSRLLLPCPSPLPGPAASAPHLAPRDRGGRGGGREGTPGRRLLRHLNYLLELHLVRNVPQQLTVKKLFCIRGHALKIKKGTFLFDKTQKT